MTTLHPLHDDPLHDGPLDAEVLDRYLVGAATPEERIRAERWLAADHSRSERIERLIEKLDASAGAAISAGAAAGTVTDTIADAAWQRFSQRRSGQRVGIKVPALERRRGSSRAIQSWRIWVATGAVVAGIAAIAVYTSREAQLPRSQTREYTTLAGQSATLVLSDGNRIVLGPQSHVRITADPSTRGRDVQVTGQALFTVKHNERAPFIVRTTNAAVRVLGTQFMVRDYPDDQTGLVVVTEGRVAVDQAVLAQGELGIIDNSGRIIARADSGVARLVAWANGELVFQEAAAADIVADLNRAYGVHVKISDSTLAKRRLTWNVQVNELPVSQALHELSLLLGAHLVRVHDTVTVVPGRRPVATPPSLRNPLSQETYYGR